MKKLYKILAIAFILSTYLMNSNAQPVPIMYDGDTLWVHPTDNSSSIVWGANDTNISHGNGAESTTNGYHNTKAIVSQLGSIAVAAYLCDTLTAYGYDNWYLPAKDELNALYQNRAAIGGFGVSHYWSSTEFNTSDSWAQNFDGGSQYKFNKFNIRLIRCVRRSEQFNKFTLSSYSIVNETTNNANDGSIDLTISGAGFDTYNWSNGETTQDISGLSCGIYSLTIIDSYLADTVIDTFTVINNEPYAILKNDTVYVHPTNNSTGIEWGGMGIDISIHNGADSDSSGPNNTVSVVKELGEGNYAAYLCDTLNYKGHNDWCLPAKEELNALYNYKDDIGGFAADYYWSSTEYNANWSYNQNFDGGSFGLTDKTTLHNVRCVRRTHPFDPLTLTLDTLIHESTNSACDGEIKISASGGSTYYAYNWSNGSTTANINGLCFGTYTVTLTDTYTSHVVVDSFTIINKKPYGILNNDTIWVYPLDNSVGIEWGGHGTDITMGNGAICDTNGTSNSAAIIATLGAGNYAASLCDTLTAYGYDDWYLPALEELNVIRDNKSVISGISPNNYWTSTEFSSNDAWTLDFSVSSGAGFSAKNTSQHLRCVRKKNTYNDLVITVDSIVEVIDGNDGAVFITVSGGDVPYAYSWSNGATTQNITGLARGFYFVTVTDSTLLGMTTDTFEVVEPAALTLQPDSQNICIGDNVSLSVSARGNATIHYQWQKDGVDLTGDTLTTLSVAGVELSDDALYRCIVTNAYGSDTSLPAKLNVIELSADVGEDKVFCNDTSVQLNANGNSNYPAESGTLVYQWSPSTGLSSTTIENPVAQPTSPITYIVTLSDDVGCSITDTIYLDSKTPVNITSQPVSQNICIGSNATISLTAAGTANHYQWKKEGVDMTGDTLSSLFIAGVDITDDADYCCEITNYCNSAVSDSVKLNIIELSVDAGSDVVFCNDMAVQLQAAGNSNYPAVSGVLSYIWSPSTGLSDPNIADPVAQPTYPVTYIVTMNDEIGCNTTDTIFLDSKTLVGITLQPTAEEIVCAGENNVSFDVSANGTAPISYQWKKDGVDMPSDTTASLLLSGVGLADAAVYCCEVSNYCNSVSSDSAVLKVVDITIDLTDKGICTEVSNHLDAAVSSNYPAESGTLSYQWTPSAGLDDATIANPMATPESTTIYKLVVTDDLGCIDSGEVEVYVQKPFQNEQICMVTVDPATAKNMVVWEKTPDKGTKAFHVYRESVISGEYTQIGYLPYDSVSSFIDPFAEPRKQQYIYKITSEDTCGNESSLDSCESHKTLLLQYSGSTGGINLMWHKYEINEVPLTYDTYQIYRGTDSLNLSYYDMVSGNTFAYVDIDQAALKQKMYYRIYGILDFQCYANAKLKANAGPFSQSISNLEDNRLKGSGIGELSAEMDIHIYPNPAYDKLNIDINLNTENDLVINIMNTIDQTVYTNEFTNTRTYTGTIDVSNWPAGLYFIQITTDEGIKPIKAIIH